MIKKQFIVTIIVDENHNTIKERSVFQFCDSVDEYIYKQIRCFENKYSGIWKSKSVKENLEMWGEYIEAKELNIAEDVCIKCDQYPYSDTDKHCPICFDEIKESK